MSGRKLGINVTALSFIGSVGAGAEAAALAGDRVNLEITNGIKTANILA